MQRELLRAECCAAGIGHRDRARSCAGSPLYGLERFTYLPKATAKRPELLLVKLGSAKAVLVAIELSRLLVVPDLSVAHREFRSEFDISLVIADGRVIQSADYDLLLIVAAHDPDPHPLADTGDRVRKLGLHVIAGFVGVSHL